MTTSRTDELLTILQEHFNPEEEGWLWLAVFRDDEPGLLNQIEGNYTDPTLAAHALARIIGECNDHHAFIAICRWDGRPTETDREMWRDLRPMVPVDRLIDMVIFNRRESWSMRAEDAAAREVS